MGRLSYRVNDGNRLKVHRPASVSAAPLSDGTLAAGWPAAQSRGNGAANRRVISVSNGR
jgi:hypothetical protein